MIATRDGVVGLAVTYPTDNSKAVHVTLPKTADRLRREQKEKDNDRPGFQLDRSGDLD